MSHPLAARKLLYRSIFAGLSMCLLCHCAVVPTPSTDGADIKPVKALTCEAETTDCDSTVSERYHYYLGLLSVYLMGL